MKTKDGPKIIDKTNIEIFDNWALNDKDLGMEKGHSLSVNKMIEIIHHRTDILDAEFNFLDLGCGNGWVVSKFSNNNLCNLAVGVDGSENMIKKAQYKDSIGKYYASSIEKWNTQEKFDIIFSMETLYYLQDINTILHKIYNLLKNKSMFIFGIDHYKENVPSLSWESEIGIKTKTRNINEWIELVKDTGFQDVQWLQYNAKDDWAGTLIISAIKY
tara:strand:- start:12 stop:659 length:648 start_codon:yes stop_codon:yes gene_type:complete